MMNQILIIFLLDHIWTNWLIIVSIHLILQFLSICFRKNKKVTVKLLIFSQSRKYVIHNVSMTTSFLYFLVEPSHESNNSLIMDYFVMSFFVCYKLSTYFAFIMLYAVFVQAIICLYFYYSFLYSNRELSSRMNFCSLYAEKFSKSIHYTMTYFY